MMRNKILAMTAMVMLFGLGARAALQYGVLSYESPEQKWGPAKRLTFKVTSGGSLWMTTYVSNWYDVGHLGDTARMTAGNYGWTTTSGMSEVGTVFASTGETTTKTFEHPTNPALNVTTTAYFLGNFEAGDEIGLWLTNKTEGHPDQIGYSLGPVHDGAHPTIELGSRQYETVDAAGNARVNFGFINGGESVEFLLYGAEYHGGGGPVGQPLPGVFATLLVAGGVGTTLTRKSRKREE